jgi:hypothetical protein
MSMILPNLLSKIAVKNEDRPLLEKETLETAMINECINKFPMIQNEVIDLALPILRERVHIEVIKHPETVKQFAIELHHILTAYLNSSGIAHE